MKQQPKTIQELTDIISQLAVTIDAAMQTRIDQLHKQVGFIGTDVALTAQLRTVENQSRRLMMQVFADLFYKLQMTNEWAAITLAMNIMQRSTDEEE